MSLVAIWFFILILQNAAFTWVSRARNSSSYLYHGIASVVSNAVFFFVQFIMIKSITTPDMTGDAVIFMGLVYVLGTVTGSLLMHWVCLKYLEKPKKSEPPIIINHVNPNHPDVVKIVNDYFDKRLEEKEKNEQLN